MKHFIVKLILFTLFIVAIDRVFIVFKYHDKIVSNAIAAAKLKKLSAYLKEGKIGQTDIAVYGSSHGQFGIIPDEISKATGMSCINFAYGGGTNIGSQESLIKRLDMKSKLMIYAIDVFSLNYKPAVTDDFQRAFFNEKRSIFDKDFDRLSYSNIYKYAHFIKPYITDIRQGKYIPPYFRNSEKVNLTMFSSYVGYNVAKNGWVAGDGIMKRDYALYADLNFDPQSGAIESLEHIVAYCRQQNTTLIFVQVPEHEIALSYKQKYIDFDNWMNKFANDHKVTYLNFDQQNAFPVGADSLFFDTDHLNARGAKLFSEQLAKAIASRL
jgi:hypothetical protein